jgi:hypothetical protein
MWDYLGRRDPTRLSSDELKEIKINDGVRTVSVLTKKVEVLSLSARLTLESRYMFSLIILCLLEFVPLFVAALE